jgi:hypothetical protein
MDIPLIILMALVVGLEGSIDIKHKTFNFKTFFKTFLSVGIFLSIIAFISDRFLPKQVSSWIFGESSWIFGGTILVLAIYITIRAFIS